MRRSTLRLARGRRDADGSAAAVDDGPAAGRFHPGHRPRRRRGPAGRDVRAAARRPSSRCPPRSRRRYAVPVGGHGWLAPGVEANGVRRGHRDATGPQGVLAAGARHPHRRPGRRRRSGSRPTSGRPRCRELPSRWGAEYAAAMRRLSDELLAAVRRRARPARPTPFTRLTSQPDLDVQHQPLPAARAWSGSPRPASSGSARTPTSARSRCSTASPAPAGCRCTRRGRAAGTTPRTTRTRSPSTSATCSRTGPAAAGARAGTGCCRRSRRARPRS